MEAASKVIGESRQNHLSDVSESTAHIFRPGESDFLFIYYTHNLTVISTKNEINEKSPISA